MNSKNSFFRKKTSKVGQTNQKTYKKKRDRLLARDRRTLRRGGRGRRGRHLIIYTIFVIIYKISVII